MSLKKILKEKDTSKSAEQLKGLSTKIPQKSNNFNFLTEVFFEAITDKVSKPLLINKIQISIKKNIRRKRKNRKKEKVNQNNLVDYWISNTNIFAFENKNKLLAKLKIDKYKYNKHYFLKAFLDCEIPLFDEYEENKIKNFYNNSTNMTKFYNISQDQQNSENNNISIINNESIIRLIMHSKKRYGFPDKYENLIELWNIYEYPNINSLITCINSITVDGFEFNGQNKNIFGEDTNVFEFEGQHMNSFAKDVNEFSDNSIEINLDFNDT
jgi:hypothetical protein